jgi:hypothetical protein
VTRRAQNALQLFTSALSALHLHPLIAGVHDQNFNIFLALQALEFIDRHGTLLQSLMFSVPLYYHHRGVVNRGTGRPAIPGRATGQRAGRPAAPAWMTNKLKKSLPMMKQGIC